MTEPNQTPPSIELPVLGAQVDPRVANHPCYSEQAHGSYARMHLPVAPGCNIQCNYCNRKFDCSNESRPGVTTDLLSPEQGLERVRRVADRIGQLSVVGIAGPGEPLANARRTMRTLELVGRAMPELRLCLSTNGLSLLDHVDQIADLGVEHVTVTVNTIDPAIGAKIYPWIAFRGQRYTGIEAARILGERQLAGISALVERGILCKVNSVVIPGVNDHHLLEVSRVVRELGAFVHNVMPLVSKPEFGTYYGVTGQREPTAEELAELRAACAEQAGVEMTIMRHCRQCRADAIGLLDQDRNTEFSGAAASVAKEAAGSAEGEAGVLVAVSSTDGITVDQHFGRTSEFLVYEVLDGRVRFVETRAVPRSCGGPEHCGEPSLPLESAVDLVGDCAAVLCCKIGPQPHGVLVGAGITPVETSGGIAAAVRAAVRGQKTGTPLAEVAAR